MSLLVLLVWSAFSVVIGIAIGLFLARKDKERERALQADRASRRVAAAALRAQIRRDLHARLEKRLAERSHPTTVVSKCGCAWLVSVNSQTRNQSRCPVHSGSATASASLTPKGAA